MLSKYNINWTLYEFHVTASLTSRYHASWRQEDSCLSCQNNKSVDNAIRGCHATHHIKSYLLSLDIGLSICAEKKLCQSLAVISFQISRILSLIQELHNTDVISDLVRCLPHPGGSQKAWGGGNSKTNVLSSLSRKSQERVLFYALLWSTQTALRVAISCYFGKRYKL